MKSVLVTFLVMYLVTSGHFSHREKRDLFQHLGNLKAGLINHFASKFVPQKKVLPRATLERNFKGPNTINSHRHSTAKNYNSLNQERTPSKSVSISSHAFLTPYFNSTNHKHTPFTKNKQTEIIVEHKNGGRESDVGIFEVKNQSEKKSYLPAPSSYIAPTYTAPTSYIAPATYIAPTYSTSYTNKKSKNTKNYGHKSKTIHFSMINKDMIKSFPEIRTNKHVPVYTPNSHSSLNSNNIGQDYLKTTSGSSNKQLQNIHTSVEHNVKNEIDVFKENKKHKTNERLTKTIDDEEPSILVIRDELWREDLVGRILKSEKILCSKGKCMG
jgi:hypothetical protein